MNAIIRPIDTNPRANRDGNQTARFMADLLSITLSVGNHKVPGRRAQAPLRVQGLGFAAKWSVSQLMSWILASGVPCFLLRKHALEYQSMAPPIQDIIYETAHLGEGAGQEGSPEQPVTFPHQLAICSVVHRPCRSFTVNPLPVRIHPVGGEGSPWGAFIPLEGHADNPERKDTDFSHDVNSFSVKKMSGTTLKVNVHRPDHPGIFGGVRMKGAGVERVSPLFPPLISNPRAGTGKARVPGVSGRMCRDPIDNLNDCISRGFSCRLDGDFARRAFQRTRPRRVESFEERWSCPNGVAKCNKNDLFRASNY